MKSHRLEYEQRVNRVIDHIRTHLAEALTLDRLADVAAFSPFHFHRIFKSITNERLFEFIQRLRIEKSAQALIFRRDAAVLEIALDCGFASAATFARAFKAHFGMSATQWRAGGYRRWRERDGANRKPGKTDRKPSKAARRRAADTPSQFRKEGIMNVQIKELPAYRVAYMRYVGPYGADGIPQLWQRFRKWTSARDLESSDTIAFGVAYDDPNISAPDRCRYDACVVVASDFRGDKQVNMTDVGVGKYAVYDFTGTSSQITDAWDRTFRSWLQDSGYQPDDRPCIELYRGDPFVDRKRGVFRCELYLPVKPF